MYVVLVTQVPSSTFGDDAPRTLTEPRLLHALRARTGRRNRIIYGDVPEVVLYNEFRHHLPAAWVNRESAQRNLDKIIARGYDGHVREVTQVMPLVFANPTVGSV